jgi:hypothetical protein
VHIEIANCETSAWDGDGQREEEKTLASRAEGTARTAGSSRRQRLARGRWPGDHGKNILARTAGDHGKSVAMWVVFFYQVNYGKLLEMNIFFFCHDI